MSDAAQVARLAAQQTGFGDGPFERDVLARLESVNGSGYVGAVTVMAAAGAHIAREIAALPQDAIEARSLLGQAFVGIARADRNVRLAQQALSRE